MAVRTAAVALAALGLGLLPGAAAADTFKPTRFDDPEPGKCKPKNCSLREAITRANKHQGPDKVKLGTGTYVIEIPENASDDNKGGDFDVIDQVGIVGRGPEKTVVDGQDVSGVFSLLTFSPHALKKMTIEGGNRDFGAGIVTGPSKTVLKRVAVLSNTATGNGGGLLTVSTNLKISNSTFAGNNADLGGGGIYMPTGVNEAPSGKIRSSTIAQNDAALGAGIYLDGAEHDIFTLDPGLDVLNSTFASNQATVSGGGIAAILGARIVLDNSTVAYNGADSDGSGGGSGGGMFQSTDGEFQIKDIILAENTVGASGQGPQCAGFFTGGGLIAGSTQACTIGGTFVADAMIGPLGDNGGPTQTVSLDLGSPAIDRPNPFDCPPLDQRGRKRDAACDAGSFERKPSDP